MKILTVNKKVHLDYEILETFEAGIILFGAEVKSAKRGGINISGSYVTIDSSGKVFLINSQIAPYSAAKSSADDPKRTRQLLLRKREIQVLIGRLTQKNLTIMPLKVYTKGGLIKVEIGLARGKKKYDKREAIKKKEWKRKKERALRG